MADYGWVDPTTGEQLPIGVSGGVYVPLQPHRRRDGGKRYADPDAFRTAQINRQRDSQQPVAQILSSPKTTTNTSRFDQENAELDAQISALFGEKSPASTGRLPVTASDIASAAQGNSPSQKDALFDIQKEYLSPDNQHLIAALGGEQRVQDLKNQQEFSRQQQNADYNAATQIFGKDKALEMDPGQIHSALANYYNQLAQANEPVGPPTINGKPASNYDQPRTPGYNSRDNTFTIGTPSGGTITSPTTPVIAPDSVAPIPTPGLAEPIQIQSASPNVQFPALPNRVADSRSDINDTLNQQPETQFLSKPVPTPTPTPQPEKKDQYV